MKALSFILIALLAASPISCAFLTQQIQGIEDMDDDSFASLEQKVFLYGKMGGEELCRRTNEATAAYIDAALGVLLTKSNFERAQALAKMLNDPKNEATVVLAVSAALDFIEAQLGKPLDLSSTGLTLRQHRLVRAMLEGVRAGLFPDRTD
ncbi:MAG TPA: hypothetical protein VMW10_04235 [Alphaproteobacteria bacterium]|nr:hypothetical protein [Alphaproteobacteria bacterium]